MIPETEDDSKRVEGEAATRSGERPKVAPRELPTLEAGTRVGDRFVIERLAGAGGMATVYVARDERDGRSGATAYAAVKVLQRASPRGMTRFAREAELLAALPHPGIVRYLAHGPLADGGTYIAMEYVEGEDLAQRLARGSLRVGEALELTERLAEALAVAHAAGVVHRDVKPSNIVLPGGELAHAKLLDFGIARVISHAPSYAARDRDARRAVPAASRVELTQGEALIGTLGYMAPEQARRAGEIDARADVFGLGCTLFCALTGRTPHQGRDSLELLAHIALEESPRLRDVWPDAPRALDDLLARLLALRADDRPRDGAAVAMELRALRALDAPGPRALAVHERLLASVVLTRAVVRDESRLERTAAAHGARLVRLADHGAALVLSSRGGATDLAARAARCALAVADAGGQAVTLATGRTEGGVAPIGAVIERAAALLRAADAPGIVVDEMSAGLLAGRYELEARRPGAHQLRAERPLRLQTHTLLGRPSPCVGRGRERRALRALLDDASSRKRARAAVVVGEAGAGKSRLHAEFVRELHQRADAPVVLTARADPLTEGAPFALLIDAIERWADLAAGEARESRVRRLRARLGRVMQGAALEHACEFLGELVRANGPLPSVELREARANPVLMSDQLRLAFEAFVRAESAERPLLIVLEDLHWGDRLSVRFIEHALEFVTDRALLVLALARPEVHAVFPGLWAARAPVVIELPPLAAGACRRLVRAALPGVSPAALGAMVERSGGNPFFLEELVRAAHAAQAGTGLEALDVDALPPTVVAVVQARVEALEASARRVLRAASVFGGVFWLGGVTAMLGPQGVAEWTAELVAREWITERADSSFLGEREFAFSHVLLREAAYAMLTRDDRTLAHRAAGAWLERAGAQDASTLAAHFERGGEPARAAREHLRAARQAFDGLDLERAIEDARRGLQLADDSALRGELHLVLGGAHHARGDNAPVLVHAQEAREHVAPASASWLHATGQAAQAYGRMGRLDELRALGDALAAHAPTEETRAAWAVACSRAVTPLFQLGAREFAIRLLAPVERQVGLLAERDLAAAAVVHGARYFRYMRQGDLPAAREAARVSQELYARAGNRLGVVVLEMNLGYLAAELGDYPEALRVLRALYARTTEMRALSSSLHALQNLGIVLARAGALREGIAALRECVEIASARQTPRVAAYGHVYLALAHALAGAWGESATHARQALALGASFPACRAYALATLARALVAQGQHGEAREAAESSEAIRATLGPVEGEGLMGLALYEARRAAGDPDGAHAALEAALARLELRANCFPAGPARERFLTAVAEHAALREAGAAAPRGRI